MPTALPSRLPELFLDRLRVEERLLREAADSLAEVHSALRRGDLASVGAARTRQESLAAALREATIAREDAAARLAAAVGLPAAGLTLSALAARLPEPLAGELQATRDRLTALTTELADRQRRNANLVGYLRSYFRSVLTALTAPGGPTRYGPAGACLPAAAGPALQARG